MLVGRSLGVRWELAGELVGRELSVSWEFAGRSLGASWELARVVFDID